VAEAGIAENLARFAVIVFMDQDPARQHAERAFDHAHVLVQHQMMNIGAVEQGADRRNQHDIVGPNQFPQFWHSFAGRRDGRRAAVNRFALLRLRPLSAAALLSKKKYGTAYFSVLERTSK